MNSIDLKKLKHIPFQVYDWGWVILSIGMAIGAGTVFMPIEIGLRGMWAFCLAFLIAYPSTYWLQNQYLLTLTESGKCEDYTNVITQYLGKNWGIFLGALYFIMMVHGIFIYSISVINDTASYINTFGFSSSKEVLSDSYIYQLLVFTTLVLIASKGEQLIFKIASPLVIIKVSIILMLGFVIIPHWHIDNIQAFPELKLFLKDVLLLLPFTFFSAVFVQVLSPMNIAYRKLESNPVIATYRSVRTHRISFILLAIIILFFSFSFTFSLSYDQAKYAFDHNISALALAAKILPGNLISILTPILNIFAVLTAFFSIYLGFQEAIKGNVTNILTRFIKKENINQTILNISVAIFIILLLTFWVNAHISVVTFFRIASPLYALVTCLIPCYLVYKVEKLHKFKSFRWYVVLIFGLILVVAPFFNLN